MSCQVHKRRSWRGRGGKVSSYKVVRRSSEAVVGFFLLG